MKTIFLVDLDDTLLNFQRAERENLKETLFLFGIELSDRLYFRFHEINDGLWKALERGEVEREKLKVLRFQRLFEEFSIDKNPKAVSRAYFENFPSIFFVFSGARGFLRALKRRGKLYLVTNGGSKIQESHLKRSRLAKYFSNVFISEKVGADKPSVAYINYVASHIPNFCKENAVWIGDSLSSDGLCAERGGIDFLQFHPSERPRGEYKRILKEISRL